MLRGWICEPATKSFHTAKGLDSLIAITSTLPVIVSVPIAIFSLAVMNPSQVRSIEIIPVVITSPIDITLWASIIITAIWISAGIHSRARVKD